MQVTSSATDGIRALRTHYGLSMKRLRPHVIFLEKGPIRRRDYHPYVYNLLSIQRN